MNVRTIVLSFVLLITFPLHARDKTDLMVMRNGDRMTCEVKGLDGGVLYVSFDYIDGTASVDWSKVAQLESQQLFVVKTEDGAVYTGTLRTPETAADRPVKIQVVETDKEDILDRSQIVQIDHKSGISVPRIISIDHTVGMRLIPDFGRVGRNLELPSMRFLQLSCLLDQFPKSLRKL